MKNGKELEISPSQRRLSHNFVKVNISQHRRSRFSSRSHQFENCESYIYKVSMHNLALNNQLEKFE